MIETSKTGRTFLSYVKFGAAAVTAGFAYLTHWVAIYQQQIAEPAAGIVFHHSGDRSSAPHWQSALHRNVNPRDEKQLGEEGLTILQYDVVNTSVVSLVKPLELVVEFDEACSKESLFPSGLIVEPDNTCSPNWSTSNGKSTLRLSPQVAGENVDLHPGSRFGVKIIQPNRTSWKPIHVLVKYGGGRSIDITNKTLHINPNALNGGLFLVSGVLFGVAACTIVWAFISNGQFVDAVAESLRPVMQTIVDSHEQASTQKVQALIDGVYAITVANSNAMLNGLADTDPKAVIPGQLELAKNAAKKVTKKPQTPRKAPKGANAAPKDT
ncbi:hypothetical protein [Schlesneria sp.]|uniref:hypothetical protein n=1 Tax=Schlesneria sp. TaxID=2762018 RepID=UPI002EEDEE9C